MIYFGPWNNIYQRKIYYIYPQKRSAKILFVEKINLGNKAKIKNYKVDKWKNYDFSSNFLKKFENLQNHSANSKIFYQNFFKRLPSNLKMHIKEHEYRKSGCRHK